MKNKISTKAADSIDPALAGKIAHMSSDFSAIMDSVKGKISLRLCPKGVSAMDIVDFLGVIQCEITSLTDGRPLPINIRDSHGYSVELISEIKQEEMKAEMAFKNANLERWGECYDPGWDTLASIGDKELNLDELMTLQKWIGDVVQWHQNHKVKPLSKTRSGK